MKVSPPIPTRIIHDIGSINKIKVKSLISRDKKDKSLKLKKQAGTKNINAVYTDCFSIMPNILPLSV